MDSCSSSALTGIRVVRQDVGIGLPCHCHAPRWSGMPLIHCFPCASPACGVPEPVKECSAIIGLFAVAGCAGLQRTKLHARRAARPSAVLEQRPLNDTDEASASRDNGSGPAGTSPEGALFDKEVLHRVGVAGAHHAGRALIELEYSQVNERLPSLAAWPM